jgi:hypothetical protein
MYSIKVDINKIMLFGRSWQQKLWSWLKWNTSLGTEKIIVPVMQNMSWGKKLSTTKSILGNWGNQQCNRLLLFHNGKINTNKYVSEHVMVSSQLILHVCFLLWVLYVTLITHSPSKRRKGNKPLGNVNCWLRYPVVPISSPCAINFQQLPPKRW